MADSTAVPPLPPGATLDAPPSAPPDGYYGGKLHVTVRGANVLPDPNAAPTPLPPLPPGATLDATSDADSAAAQQASYAQSLASVKQNQSGGILPTLSQGLSGVNEGIADTLGFPVDAMTAAMRLGSAGLKAAGGPDIQMPVNAFGGSQSIMNLMGPAITAPTSDPTGQFARRVGQDIGATALPTGSVASAAERPLASLAFNLGTAAAGGVGAGTLDQIAPGNKYADAGGELLGDALSLGGSRVLQRAISPFPITPERRAVNDVLQNEGIDLTAGQATGNTGLKYVESELGGGAAQNMTDRQQGQFTAAALRRAGVNADRATPDVMAEAFDTLGDQFDQLAARNDLIPDRQLGSDLSGVVNTYNDAVAPSNRAPIVRNSVNDIVGYVRNGRITGSQYADLRARLNRQGRELAKSDPALSRALFGIQSTLDANMERTIGAINPNDLGAWRQARRQYANLIILENAAARAGESSAMGVISPAALRSAVQAANKRSYVTGRGDLAELSRAGVAGMTPLPQSGTAPRMAARTLGAGILAAIGSAIGGAGGNMQGAIAGAAAGAAVPYAVGRGILSPLGRRYLTNQLATAPLEASNLAIPTLAAAMQRMRSGQ